MGRRLTEEERESMRDSGPSEVVNAAQPVYYHIGPITGDYVYDILGRKTIHMHVTLYAPIDDRPIKKALRRKFGGFKRCDVLCFGEYVGKAGEWGVLHAEVEIPMLPLKVIDDFVRRLIKHVFLQHNGCSGQEMLAGLGPLGKPIFAYQVQ